MNFAMSALSVNLPAQGEKVFTLRLICSPDHGFEEA